LESLENNKRILKYTKETSVAGKKTSSKCKEHTYAQCKEMCAIYGHMGECFLLRYMCQIAKAKIENLAMDENV
jgi:hypothetical protein